MKYELGNREVFLGGTIYGHDWRTPLYNELTELGFKPFNPIVEDWTPEFQEVETKMKIQCDINLYHINSNQKGMYTIAEVVSDSIKYPQYTHLVIDKSGFEEDAIRSFNMIEQMVKSNGAYVHESLDSFLIEMSKAIKQIL